MTTVVTDRPKIQGEHLHLSPAGDYSGPLYWKVIVHPTDGVVERIVQRGTSSATLVGWLGDERAWQPEEVIWPAWTPALAAAGEHHTTPLREAREHWGRLGDRLRESAKWMSTVLGAALALLLGTSPLGKLSEASFSPAAIGWGIAGLGLLFVTMLLLLNVMQPTAVSFADVQKSDQVGVKDGMDSLVRWKHVVQSQQDLYLPCGINSLDGLRNAIIVEEATLAALACAIQRAAQAECRATDENPEAAAWATARHGDLEEACKVRVARLHDLKDAVAEITAIGEFYLLRQRSLIACIGGTLSTAIGIACIVAGLAALPG
jgi:hypothetical protein